MRYSRFIAILPLALVITACADEQVYTAQSGDKPTGRTEFSDGYKALKDGDYAAARQDLGVARTEMPSNAYEALDLGAADQNSGRIAEAVPLYRQAISQGQNLYPVDTTTPDTQGMTVAQIAIRNLRIAGLDANGAPLTRVAAATPVVQSGSSQAAGATRADVYFGFDRADVSPQAATVIRSVAAAATANGARQISVIGHTDTAGPADYNQELSDRRAEAVKAALAQNGVPATEVEAKGVGEAGLQVPTPAGVPEAENRRAEVVVK